MDILSKALSYNPSLEEHTIRKIVALETWDFSQLIEDMAPRLLLSEGRLFSIEQLIPILLHFAQEDNQIKVIAREALTPWLSDEPYFQQRSKLSEDFINESCSKIKFIISRIAEEFRKFVAISLIEPNQVHAPSGPVDMFWHFMILHTVEYNRFCEEVWGGHEFDKNLDLLYHT